MIILGIDPGSRKTGYGMIRFEQQRVNYIDSGCITMDVKQSMSERLKTIFQSMDYLIKHYHPDHVVIEQIFMYENANSALKLGQARGIAMCVSALHDLPVFEYTPTKIKQSVSGHGHATKDQINHMVKTLLRIDHALQTDAADALAAALCHAFHWPTIVAQMGK